MHSLMGVFGLMKVERDFSRSHLAGIWLLLFDPKFGCETGRRLIFGILIMQREETIF